MPTTPLNLYTRPKNESHKRENWHKIGGNFGTVNADITVLEGLSWQTLTSSETAALTICQPVYSDGDATVALAQADALITSAVTGLVFDATIVGSGTGRILQRGDLTATTAQWDAVTGDTGGLTAGSVYYVDPATAGLLTTTATTTATEVQAPIGIAMSATVMKFDVGERVRM